VQGPCPVTYLSLIPTPAEKSAHCRPCGQARQLGQCARERDRELDRGVSARLDGHTFASLSVVDRTACDGARPITADLHNEARDDGRFIR